MASANGLTLDKLRGIALFDPTRDARLTSLSSFDAATKAITKIPNLIERFGPTEETRIVLQFVYQYFGRMDNIRYEEAVFEGLWRDFTAELQDANWIVRSVANLRNFNCDTLLVDLGDGVTIRGRNPDDLATLGFGAAVWERVAEDWSGPGASSFVLVAEHSFAKQPNNMIDLNSSSVWAKAQRAIGALRLADAGSISIGPMWVVRAARFNVGIGGLTRQGASIPGGFGSQFRWTESVWQVYPAIYGALSQLEQEGYRKSPGNLEIALRAFIATYDRWPPHWDSQLLDSITALEALLGGETEISFKLSFRVAGLLAANDKERAALLTLVKEFYDSRSHLVHGGQLNEKHQGRLARVDELRSIVRRLLRAFVAFAIAPADGYNRAFFKERLDTTLVNATEREKLRTALGLSRSSCRSPAQISEAIDLFAKGWNLDRTEAEKEWPQVSQGVRDHFLSEAKSWNLTLRSATAPLNAK